MIVLISIKTQNSNKFLLLLADRQGRYLSEKEIRITSKQSTCFSSHTLPSELGEINENEILMN